MPHVAPVLVNSDREYLDSLPTPVAHAFHELALVSGQGDDAAPASSLLMLWHTCDAVEVIVRTLAAVLFSDLTARGQIASAAKPLSTFNFRRPTLGNWKNLLATLLEELPRNSALFRELEALRDQRLFDNFFDGRDRPEEKTLYVRQFTHLRNRLAHGAGLTRQAADLLLDNWAERIAHFFHSNGAWLREVHFRAHLGDALYELRGLNPVRLPPAAAASGAGTVLAQRADTAVSLWPLMLFGVPRVPGLELEDDAVAVQVYSSLDSQGRRVYYTPIGCPHPQVHWSVADEATTSALFRAFEPLQRLEDKPTPGALDSFRKELLEEARQMMGREETCDEVLDELRCADRRNPVLWLHGPAGSGKSTLMAKVVARLIDTSKTDRQDDGQGPRYVIPYRFRAGDARCSRSMFLLLLGESLRVQARADANLDERLHLLKQALQRFVAEGGSCIFVLDGLDEIVAGDPDFIDEVLLGLLGLELSQPQRVTWLLSGRDSLTDELRAAGAHVLFPQGLPRLQDKDVRAMMLEGIGRKRAGLLRADRATQRELGRVSATPQLLAALNSGQVPLPVLRLCKPDDWVAEQGNQAKAVRRSAMTDNGSKRSAAWLIDDDDDHEMYVAVLHADEQTIAVHADRIHSSFVEGVTRRAEGLPIYVRLVIDDIRDNEYDSFDHARLPRDLARYYNRLLNRYGVNGVQPLLTPVVCFVAVARDAVSFAQLEDAVVAALLPDEPPEVRQAMLREALDILASMLSTRSSGEGGIGYAIYHQSLREYLDPVPDEQGRLPQRDADIRWLDEWIRRARKLMITRCLRAAEQGLASSGVFAGYLARFGVDHLLSQQHYAAALRLLSQLLADDGAGAGLSPTLLAEQAQRVAEALEAGVQAVRDAAAGSAAAEAARQRLRDIAPADLRALIGEGYETGLYSAAIRILIEYHPAAWEEEKALRLASPYDLVFRHDVGEALADVWLEADPALRPVWMQRIRELETSAHSRYDREIAGYAFKHICEEHPELVDLPTLRSYAGSAGTADRMVAGELLVSLVVHGRDIGDWVHSTGFADSHWPYLRTDIDDIQALQLDEASRDAAVKQGGGLARAITDHRAADALRQRLLADPFFADPAHAPLARLLQGYGEQVQHIDELDRWVTVLGKAYDGERAALVVDYLKALMCHPLWNMIESVSTLVRKLIARNSARWPLIDRLVKVEECNWRVRYGVVDAAFNTGYLDDFQCFRRQLLNSYRYGHCRVRGLCADDLLGWVRLSSASQRAQILADPDIVNVVRFWVAEGDDFWVLEYVYLLLRFVRERREAGETGLDLQALMADGVSRYLAGERPFYECEHHELLDRMEAVRRGEPAADNGGA